MKNSAINKENRPSFPQELGQRFKTSFNDDIYTVKSFFGESGIEYNSLDECIENNKQGSICVKNTQYGGATLLDDTFLVIE